MSYERRTLIKEAAKSGESWPKEFEQRDKWSFCLSVARMAVEQERQ
jgi:hypothetical protein